ncbi:MAG: hypothetical protein RL380_1428, partial [Verrucomicrobiota bacterium]
MKLESFLCGRKKTELGCPSSVAKNFQRGSITIAATATTTAAATATEIAARTTVAATATTTTAAGRTVFAGASDVDGEGAAINLGAVERGDGAF